MNRAQIIENYLDLSRKAHEVEHYWENGVATDEELDLANNRALHYMGNFGITRKEITDHQDQKRNVTKCDSVDEALAAMQNIFG